MKQIYGWAWRSVDVVDQGGSGREIRDGLRIRYGGGGDRCAYGNGVSGGWQSEPKRILDVTGTGKSWNGHRTNVHVHVCVVALHLASAQPPDEACHCAQTTPRRGGEKAPPCD